METEWFFGHHVDPVTLAGKSLMLILAIVLGGLIGIERQWHGNPAGMRTHILVCLGSTVITITSVEIGLGVRGGMRGDPGHIAAQIVSGVGFLGAGAIMREGATVRGLTTAASVWATAGIGLALGASPRLAELAVVATVGALVTLTLLTQVEAWFKLRDAFCALDMEVDEAHHGPAKVLDFLYSHGITVLGVQSEPGAASLKDHPEGATRQMRMRVKLPRTFSRNEFNKLLAEQKGVISFHLE